MTRKSISTSHTVVICAVCGRTLLRGEHAEVFISGGARRTVCELCIARAAHEGWMREGLDDVGVRRNGGGRSRSLLGRLRQRREDPSDDEVVVGEHSPESEAPAYAPPAEPRNVHAVPTNADLKIARALEVFNGSAHPRTVAGVGRSLGTASVVARPSPTEGTVVSIVVAWELCWYRYEVDLGNEAAGVRVTDQGAELAELDPADQGCNAAAESDGTLKLLG